MSRSGAGRRANVNGGVSRAAGAPAHALHVAQSRAAAPSESAAERDGRRRHFGLASVETSGRSEMSSPGKRRFEDPILMLGETQHFEQLRSQWCARSAPRERSQLAHRRARALCRHVPTRERVHLRAGSAGAAGR